MEPVADLLAMLARIAPVLQDTRTPGPGQEPFYDLMAGGLVWRDEVPEHLLRTDDWDVVRYLWHYRTRLICRETPARYQALWEAGKRLFPDWVGFAPGRASPNEQLAALVRNREMEIERELDEMGHDHE